MPTVGSLTREALLIIAILRLIPRNRYISRPELQCALQETGYALSDRRLQRLLKDIVECDDLHVECDKRSKPFGYRQKIPDSIAQTHMSPQAALLLRLAEEHLRNQIPTSLMQSLQPLFEQARASLNEHGASARQSAWLQKVAFVPDAMTMMPPNIKRHVFECVSQALYCDRKLEITYCNLQQAQSTYTVSPLGLVQQAQRLYLICQFEHYDNIRHLALHRMQKVVVLDHPAERPKDFSLAKYLQGRHTNYSNGEKIRLVVEFSNPDMAKVLTETPLNRTQTIAQLPDGAWRLEAITDDTVLVDGWIATWKDSAGIRHVDKVALDADRSTSREPQREQGH